MHEDEITFWEACLWMVQLFAWSFIVGLIIVALYVFVVIIL